ncbi:signal transduction histidine kinase [Murinocardiopsis flavida]|uniref:histidine kinase n=1 Tax=Murinocardiopsis flavida TaxID=645275 RepID=A0A2P8DLJ5_9ACTN|nr:histidine kinase [Murinocardiopsis flavida]PSK98082.1 signal transduction histidine kinase [Murinocardiopsis flavida]
MSDTATEQPAANAPVRFPSVLSGLRTRTVLTDLLVVAVLAIGNTAVVAAVGAAPSPPGAEIPFTDPVVGYTAGVAVALLTLGRRMAPLSVFVAVTAVAVGAQAADGFAWAAAGPGMGIAAYAIGRHHRLRRARVALACAAALTIMSSLMDAQPQEAVTWFFTAYSLAMVAGAWWAGRLVRLRAAHVAELQARAERLERARDAHGRAVLAEERSRIARELHDVVAHHVSVMTVQATAGRRVMERDPDRARQTLTDIEETGRQALAEMRRIVGVLRTGAAEAAARAPQPGLAGLDELVDQVREAGMTVVLRLEGRSYPLPSGLDLTLYRVVQESLTNVFKHAGEGAGATVSVRYEPRLVQVLVEDDGAGPGARGGGDEPGHGLLGMRERVGLYGGELAAGPGAAGGFAVSARVPVEQGGCT